MKKLRVMHVIIGNGFGGLENVMLDLVRQGDRERFEYFILCLSTPDVIRDKLEASGATVLDLGYGEGFHPGLALAIRKVINEHGIDVVHSHDYKPFFYTTLGCLGKRGLAKVYTEHSSILSMSRKHQHIGRLFARFTDAMVMVSRHLQQYWADPVGLPAERSLVIHNGIDVRLFDHPEDGETLKREFGLEGKLVIGTALRLNEQKGLQYLVAAAPAVKERFPDARFLVIGEGPLRDDLATRTRTLGVDDVFLFPGYRSDVSRILPAFDIYVLPSLWEGLPLGMIEAMLAKLPIVATTVGGVPEVLVDRDTALLVPPADSEALGEALCHLADSADLRRIMGERGRGHALAEYSLQKMVTTYETLYHDILAAK
ncbi:glycosyltransferase [Pseudodesulfovibrio methanolicus]|uniref:Glycosyltransferase n=1 Tax=Pseudodesulfovibrio methanolicus TaxID=3126690 RepID=A0ABZ2ITH7_9BACT